MTRLFFITVFGGILSLHGQDYTRAGVIFELIGEHAEMSEFFESRDSSFQIAQFKLNEKKGTLEPVGRCVFSFLNNDVIQTCVFVKKRIFCKKEYWKWTENERGDKFGYIEMSSKDGSKMSHRLSFNTIETTTTGSDSIVDQKLWWVREKGDTMCHFIDRWIYKNDTLLEYWHESVIGGEYRWENCNDYFIEKYQYPAQNTTITKSYLCTHGENQLRATHKVIKFYNQAGQLTSVMTFWSDESNRQGKMSEKRYFYVNGKWEKTERWSGGTLFEIIIKTTIAKTNL